jgi:hypothetical protein
MSCVAYVDSDESIVDTTTDVWAYMHSKVVKIVWLLDSQDFKTQVTHQEFGHLVLNQSSGDESTCL